MSTILMIIFLLASWLLIQAGIFNFPKKSMVTTAGLFSAIAFASMGSTAEASSSLSVKQATKYYQALSSSEQPDYVVLHTTTGHKTSGNVKRQNVTLFRWQRSSGVSLGGDHVSFLLNTQGELAGFARMIPSAAASPLPPKEKAEQIAREFLQEYAPDLLPVMNIQWIKPHTDEKYTDGLNQYRINGMKVKCRNAADGTYFWVIVGNDDSVIVFERDIEWDFIRAGRQTEKWLHDDWLQKNNVNFTQVTN